MNIKIIPKSSLHMTSSLLITSSMLITLGLLAACSSNNVLPSEAFSCSNMPVLQPGVPFDVDLPSHPNVQCFAWQEFIALNWPALTGSPGQPDTSRDASTWGDPGDMTPGVWETYKEAHEVFLPNAEPPSPWGVSGLARSFAPSMRMRMAAPLAEITQDSGTHVFRMTSKVSPRLEREDQAFGTGWLTGQNRKLTYYDIRMNRVAFDYIVANQFYDARQQAGQFINLPAGSTGAGATPAAEGAIEIKSAWLEMTGIPAADQRRFRTTRACIAEASGCRWTTVGLVGLHIVHKTETFPQWTWATFEHVDNAPDREDIRQGTLRGSYTYHDPSCSAAVCPPNTNDPGGDRTLPVQVVRQTPIAEDARELNAIVQAEIRRQNPDSVWQYYQLVDVQWPEAGETITSRRNRPLPRGGPRPTSLANATLETFVQHSTCLECHRNAGAASPPSQASDYSFLFEMADSSPPP